MPQVDDRARVATHRIQAQDEAEAFLASGAAFPAGSGPPVRIETHGAVVVLAGETAYKLKKAVAFPFLDLSTVEKRKAACEAELAINRRFAPGLYRGVHALRRRSDGLVLGGEDGEVVDWVVEMRRFDETSTFDRLASSGALTGPLMDAVAAVIADSHAGAPVGSAAGFVTMLHTTLEQNLSGFGESPELFAPARVASLDVRMSKRLAQARHLIEARGAAGLVRRCHGDLHLRNIALVDGAPMLFDALEFDEAIATGDVLYDLAFVLMDLWTRGLRAEANRLFNAYVERTRRVEDLAGLALLPLYLAVRASIRAKVTAAQAAGAPEIERRRLGGEAQAYFDAAETFLLPAAARLVAVGGLSGTGKTSVVRAVAAGIGPPPGALHLRSDTERKALFHVAPTDPLPETAYAPEVSGRVFKALNARALAALGSGHGVVLDAVFARKEERAAAERVAIGASVPFRGLFLTAPLGTRLSRVETRVGDASDARGAVVLAQEAYDIGPLTWDVVDAGGDVGETVADVRRLLTLPF